ncbi:MAG: hypothetical protein HQK64_10055 [Desulfamplus sp.]|nr:hypothetical protein [Desulfamplus sp.]
MEQNESQGILNGNDVPQIFIVVDNFELALSSTSNLFNVKIFLTKKGT